MKKKNILMDKLIEALGGSDDGEQKESLKKLLSDKGIDRESVESIVQKITEYSFSGDVEFEELRLDGIRQYNVFERMLLSEEAIDVLTFCKYLGLVDDNELEKVIEIVMDTDRLPVDKGTVIAAVSYVSGIDLNITGLNAYR